MAAAELDHYALLKVHPSATVEQIKAAYLREVSRWHPDRNPSTEAGTRTAQINAAWEVLPDPNTRAAYDRRLKLSPAAQPAAPTTPRTRKQPPSQAARPPRPAPAAPDPAAAERARRAAEASAREAETLRRRNAEAEQRRKAAEHLWQPPPDSALGWPDRDFVIGHWYRNNRGPYRVIDVRGNLIDIYYPDGDIATFRREELWPHWQRQVQRRDRGSPSRYRARR